MFRKMFYICVLYFIFISPVSAAYWNLNSSIVVGLQDVGLNSDPSVFNYGGIKLISGNNYGTFNGYDWNGSSWVSNSSLVNGLGDVGIASSPFVFERDGLKLIAGENSGAFNGYDWNGSSWVSNSSLVVGLSDTDGNSVPSIFYNGTKLISGGIGTNYYGDYYGYDWNGSSWVSNSSLVVGLSTPAIDNTAPNVYYYNDCWNMLLGRNVGTFIGYNWNGLSWVSTPSIIGGIGDIGLRSKSTVFYNNGYKLITGENSGVFTGYTRNEVPTVPTISSPSNNSYHTSQPITIQANSTDADGDSITYYFYGDTVDGSTLLGTSTNGTYVWHQYISEDYILKVRAHDGYEYSDYSTVYFHSLIPPLLTTDFVANGNFENWSAGESAAPDDFTIYGGGCTIAKETTTVKIGMSSAKLTRSTSNCALYQSVENLFGEPYFQNKILTASVWGYATVANSVKISINDGYDTKSSNYHSGSGSWELLTVSMLINNLTTNTKVEMWVLNNPTSGYFDDAILVEGAYPYISEPLNNSMHTFDFPPLLHDLTFTWQDSDADGYKYQIATDENFNLISDEGSLSTYTTDVSLTAGDYFWRLFAYDPITDTYSDSSDVWQFTINETTVSDGTAIDGVVYEIINAGSIAVEGALVNIWNTTWSDSMLVGQNGYYFFDGAKDGTYSVRATKTGYTDSSIELVTVLALNTTTRNILLQSTSGAGQQYVDHYVKFTVKTMWGTLYSGVEVKVYLGDAVIPQYTGTTGTDGSISFELNEYQEYRLTFVSATHGIDEELVLYPVNTEYSVYIYDTLAPDDEDIESEEVTVSVATAEINDTHAYINVTYTDAMAETTDLNIYINQSDESDPFNQTIITYANLGATSSVTHSFIIDDYPGQAYFINVGATHTTFGDIQRTYSVRFDGMLEDHGFSKIWVWIGVGGMMFVAGMFKASKAEQGALVVCVVGWVFMGFGFFDSLGSQAVTSMAAGLGLATVLAVGANMSKKDRDETT